jgi:hypothetical protein
LRADVTAPVTVYGVSTHFHDLSSLIAMVQLQEQRELCSMNRKKFEEEFDNGIIFGVFQEVTLGQFNKSAGCYTTELAIDERTNSTKKRSASSPPATAMRGATYA